MLRAAAAIWLVWCMAGQAIAQTPYRTVAWPEYRVWRDSTGEYQVRASLVGVKYDREARDQVVTLRKEDGDTVDVPSRRLGKEDTRIIDEVDHIGNMNQSGEVDSVVFSPDGEQVLTSSDWGTMLWDGKTGNRLGTFIGKPSSEVKVLRFTPDAQRILVVGSSGDVFIWDPAKFECESATRCNVPGTGAYETAPVLSRDCRRLLRADGQRLVLWDIRTGKEASSFPGFCGIGLHSIAIALGPDGRHIAVGSRRDPVVLLDVQSGQQARAINTAEEGWMPGKDLGGAMYATFDPDGTRVFTSKGTGWQKDYRAYLWEVSTGKRLHTFRQPFGFVRCAAFSADGRRLATGCGKAVVLWDVATARSLKVFRHRDLVRSVDISPDGERVLSGSRDGTAGLWSATTGRRLHTFGKLR
ncbi:MAG: hypothetical protein H8E44_41120 [Planctomycetes bacterium]|nr:hypothetical protein [Planctomycetota bacterium]